MKITRRTLFARLAAAVAGMPLVGKLAAKVGGPDRTVVQLSSRDFRIPFDLDPRRGVYVREIEDVTRAEMARHYPSAEFNDVQARINKQVNRDLDELLRQQEVNLDYWIGRHEAAREKIAG